MMFEIVAVGAMATQFELRIPCSAMRCAQRRPVERRRFVDVDVPAALVAQQRQRVLRQHAAIPQASLVRRIAAAFLGELRRRPVGVIANRFHRRVGELHCRRRAVRYAHGVQAVLEAHDAESRPGGA